jgi:hypothetical protein
MKRVVVESPFKGDVERNKLYLERCLRDCVMRGESPYASHKMLTDCLDDDDPKEREMGITAGYAWWTAGDLVVFYVDFGWSSGMTRAWERCRKEGVPYETRIIPADAEYVRIVQEEKEQIMTKLEQCVRLVHALDPGASVETRYDEGPSPAADEGIRYFASAQWNPEASDQSPPEIACGKGATLEEAVDALYQSLSEVAERMRVAVALFDAQSEGVAP